MSIYVPDWCEAANRQHEFSDLDIKTSGFRQYIRCRHCKKNLKVQA